MTNALSLYLDALRFGAAFTVFLSHWATARYTGGQFWRFTSYGRIAVLVFFVVSGFVIAWVAETRERSFDEFALSRAARLYSVVVPAFAVTAALDAIGMAINSGLYEAELRLGSGQQLLGYALSAVFLGESWKLTLLPGSDVPFWSLNYEVWYYVMFAAATFLRGRRRTLAIAIAALLAGPKILLLLPIWLAGVAAWRWRSALPGPLAAPLALGAVAAFAAFEALGGREIFRHAEASWLPFDYSAYDYIVGALVMLLIMGLANARLPMPGRAPERLIRWLAGTSFGLYLLHKPLLNFFGTIVPGRADGTMHAMLLFGLSLGASLALAHLTEPRKAALKRGLRSALAGGGLRAALDRQRLP